LSDPILGSLICHTSFFIAAVVTFLSFSLITGQGVGHACTTQNLSGEMVELEGRRIVEGSRSCGQPVGDRALGFGRVGSLPRTRNEPDVAGPLCRHEFLVVDPTMPPPQAHITRSLPGAALGGGRVERTDHQNGSAGRGSVRPAGRTSPCSPTHVSRQLDC
jgi:hypothetical protein